MHKLDSLVLSWDAQVEGENPVLVSCPLTSTHTPDIHAYTHRQTVFKKKNNTFKVLLLEIHTMHVDILRTLC